MSKKELSCIKELFDLFSKHIYSYIKSVCVCNNDIYIHINVREKMNECYIQFLDKIRFIFCHIDAIDHFFEFSVVISLISKSFEIFSP